MQVLVTGSQGFIAQNLIERLSKMENVQVSTLNKGETKENLIKKVLHTDFIFHLAGINRPKDPQEYYEGNRDLTQSIVEAAMKSDRDISILMSSSTQVIRDNDYGRSKLGAEESLKSYNKRSKAPVYIYRLPNVFGKWCRPNYNSVVATWCYNLAHGLPIQVNDETVVLNLVYIDDVVNAFIKHLDEKSAIEQNYFEVSPVYQKSLGEIRDLLLAFKDNELSLDTLDGFDKALYETYKNYIDDMEN